MNTRQELEELLRLEGVRKISIYSEHDAIKRLVSAGFTRKEYLTPWGDGSFGGVYVFERNGESVDLIVKDNQVSLSITQEH